MSHTGSFEKYAGNPVFGDKSMGTMFDAFVRKQPDGRLRMDVSWRPRESFAVTFSDDGFHWSELVITLGPDKTSGWTSRGGRGNPLP